jgi:MscS family membrane protein
VEIRKLLYSHPLVDADPARVRFVALNTYSLDIEIFAYVNTADFNEFLAVQEDILLRIMALVEESGAAFALPRQTTYFARETGLDSERVTAAEKKVHEWRQRGELALPHFSSAQIEELKGRLEYPGGRSIRNLDGK